MDSTAPIDVFIGYSQADTRFLEQLRKQLTAVERVGLVDAWHDGEIEAGSNREEAIRKAMDESEIIILLISADFIASEFNYEKEMKWAMELHEKKQIPILPVILKDCTWKYAPFAHLKVLPRGGIPVTDDHWKSTDRAFKQVVEEVVRISHQLKGTPIPSSRTEPVTDTTPAAGESKKGSFLNLKNGLIALLALIVLGFFGSQIFGSDNNTQTDTEISQTLDTSQSQSNEAPQNEIGKKQETPANPPVKKQAPPENPKKETTNKVQEQPQQQPKTYDQPTERINTPPAEEKKPAQSGDQTSDNELEILPEPEPPKAKPKKYRISGGMVTDLRDNKAYDITTINGKTWMRENLNLNVNGAYCPDNCANVGRLYDFTLAQKVCPEGWRLPTKAEWKALTDNDISHLRLSATLTGTKYRQQFLQAGQKGYYWSSDRAGGDESWSFEISQSGYHAVDRRYSFQGMHCRCVLNE